MKIPSTIKEFAKTFHSHGFKLYLVGGAVRDNLLKKKNTDYDFATDALPEDTMSIFPTVIPVGIDHGTVLVVFRGHHFEVTTFRSETTYSDYRRPDSVTFISSIDEDLKRRDFTINAMAWDISGHELIDNFNGKKDLKHKIIRAIGTPSERFTEDALRMVRACRFAGQLGFTIEETTLSAISKLASLIDNISRERIRDELIKIIESPKPSIGLEYLRETGLMQFILPELLDGYGMHQNQFHRYDVYYHNIYSCDAAPGDNYIVRFAALFHDIAKPVTRKDKDPEAPQNEENSFYNHEIVGAAIARKILKRLKFKNDDIKAITHLIKHHMFFYTDEWTDGAVRRFVRKVGIENIPDLFLLRMADREGNGTKSGVPRAFYKFQEHIDHIIAEDSALKVTDLEVDGNDLMQNLSLPPGPIIGEILRYLLELVLDNPELNTRESLLTEAASYYQKKSEYALEEYGKPPEELGKF